MLPKRARLHFVSDFETFWKVFHPDFRWIDLWHAEGFRKKPRKNAEEWKKLHEVMSERELIVSAGPPSSDDDRELLDTLTKAAREAPDPRPAPAPGDPIDDRGVFDSAEWLYIRALKRDD